MEDNIPEEYYWILDSRAGEICIKHEIDDLSGHDWTKYILVGCDTGEEACDYANSGDYGNNCVVANRDGRVLFEWFVSSEWVPSY